MDALKVKFNNVNGDKTVLTNQCEQMQKELKIMRQNHQSIVTKYQKIDPKEYQRLVAMEKSKNAIQQQLNKYIAANNEYQSALNKSKQIHEQNKNKLQGINAKNQSLLSQLQSFKQNKQ